LSVLNIFHSLTDQKRGTVVVVIVITINVTTLQETREEEDEDDEEEKEGEGETANNLGHGEATDDINID